MAGNQEAFQKAMNQGHSAAWDQQWEQAAQSYRQALAEFPDQPSALTSLGLALFELQQYDEALRYYQQAAKISPADPVPLEKSARIYEKRGRISEAVQASLQAAELHLKAQEIQKAMDNWTSALSLQPENLLAHSRLGMVYERMGKKLEAVSEYLSAAGVLQRAGDAGRAMQLAEHGLQVLPESGDARRAISMLKAGQMLPRPGKQKAAEPAAERKAEKGKAAELPAPSSGSQVDPLAEARQKAMVQLAAILFDQADDDSASSVQQSRRGLAALTRGLPGFGDDQGDRTRILMHLSQAIDSQTHGDDSQAAAELERAEEAGLSHPAVHFELGMLTNGRDAKKALRCLQESVKHPDFMLASYLLMGQNYEGQDCLREAAVSYIQALRCGDLETVTENQREGLDQLYEPLIENLSQQAEEANLKNICETIAGQMLRPDWRDYLRAARQQMTGQTGGVPAPLAEMLLESRGSQVVELLSKVRTLTQQSKYRSAMEEAFYALQFAPTYLPLHLQIGELLLAEGHVQSAVSKFLLVANLYSLRGEAGNAARLLTRLIQMAPMDVTVRMALINLYAAQGRTEDAMQQYIDLGDFYYQMSELDKARTTYLAALKLPQSGRASKAASVRILRKAADIDLQRLDWRNAVRSFEMIRNLQPEDPEARASLVDLNLRLGQDEAALSEMDGYISYLESMNQRSQAIEFSEGLLKDREERMDMRKRLADLYLRDGQQQKAVEQLDMIADGLLSARNKAGAISMLETIVALNPPNVSDYKSALAKLKN